MLAAISSFGQKTGASRADTENWLLQKMNSNIGTYTLHCSTFFNDPQLSVCLTYTNITFSFSGDKLIIDANTKRTEKGQSENYKTKWTIPLNALTSKNVCITDLTFSCSYSAIAENSTNGLNFKISSLKFDFSSLNEENLCERINKAFNHLGTFIKKPKSTEPF